MIASIVVLAPGQAGSASESWLLAPAGRQAMWVAEQAWTLFGVGIAIYLAVGIVFVIALVKGTGRRGAGGQDGESGDGLLARHAGLRGDLLASRVVIGSCLLAVLILLGLLALDLATRRGLAAIAVDEPQGLEIVGHQYWWHVEYPDPDGGDAIVTANEIHIPVAEPIRIRARTQDVIHALWIPALAGKVDLVPGREATLWLSADRAGDHAGRCAEFCGLQHAGMGLRVVAEEPEAFDRWLASQAEPARAPQTARQERGLRVFLESACVGCHAIRGTSARGRLGPDLTHLASRSTLGAAVIPNDPQRLRAWIDDPHQMKPGTTMPASDLDPEELDALVAYLGILE